MSAPPIVSFALTADQMEVLAQRVAEIIDSRADSRTTSPYLTIPQAAELLRCSRGRVDNLLSQGRLTRVKDGRRTLIERTEVEAYLAGQSTGPGRWFSALAC